VRLPYAGESTVESRNDVSDAGGEASDAAPALPATAAAAASCGVAARSAASAAASAGLLDRRDHAPEPDVLLRAHEHVREGRGGRTHGTPVHERAPVVQGRDRRERERGVLLGPDLGDQAPPVEPAHRVCHEVHAATVYARGEGAIELLRALDDGRCPVGMASACDRWTER
jgi:hypothetical protein